MYIPKCTLNDGNRAQLLNSVLKTFLLVIKMFTVFTTDVMLHTFVFVFVYIYNIYIYRYINIYKYNILIYI